MYLFNNITLIITTNYDFTKCGFNCKTCQMRNSHAITHTPMRTHTENMLRISSFIPFYFSTSSTVLQVECDVNIHMCVSLCVCVILAFDLQVSFYRLIKQKSRNWSIFDILDPDIFVNSSWENCSNSVRLDKVLHQVFYIFEV